MGKIISIQPSNTPSGEYDVHMALPYPFHIDVDTSKVLRQDMWKGNPATLIGFQQDVDVQRVDLFLADAMETNPHRVVGMYPVFSEDNGGLYTYILPINSVTVTDESEASA